MREHRSTRRLPVLSLALSAVAAACLPVEDGGFGEASVDAAAAAGPLDARSSTDAQARGGLDAPRPHDATVRDVPAEAPTETKDARATDARDALPAPTDAVAEHAADRAPPSDTGAPRDAAPALDGTRDAGPSSGRDAGGSAPDAASGATDAPVDRAEDRAVPDEDGEPSDSTSNEASAADGGPDDAVDEDAPPPCAVSHVLISQIRSRGLGGGSDEFVELYNPTAAAVTLDATYSLTSRSTTSAKATTRWKGAGEVVPALGHFLIAGASYVESPTADALLSTGITDAASVALLQSGSPIDAVCYFYDAATLASFDPTFDCEGAPVSNLPHDNASSATSDADVSLERLPGGAAGNCTDTGDSAADFVSKSPAEPRDTASPPTP